MLVTWKYRPRDTIVQRLDPRARILFVGFLSIALTQLWDLRLIWPIFGFLATFYALARIPWSDIWRAWRLLLIFITLILLVNGIFTVRGGPPSVVNDQSPIWLQTPDLILPGLGWNLGIELTAARASFIVAQFSRMVSFALLVLTIPYTINPSDYGVAFRRLGLPDKVSYSIDLAFRLVPTLGRDFTTTLDAQRARGYEVDKLQGGLFERIRRLAPLVVPVVITAILSGEEIIDAMDLRAFGTHKRTWTRKLQYHLLDILYIGLGLVILIGTFVLGWYGIGNDIWIAPFVPG